MNLSRNLVYFCFLSLLVALSGTTTAQPMTLSQMYQKIDQAFPDNVAGKISASQLRARFKDVALMLDQRGTPDLQPFTLSQLRGITATAAEGKLTTVFLKTKGQEGIFLYDAADASSTDDSLFVLVTKSGRRYKRYVPNYIITPELCGAVGDSLTDDGLPLQKFWNAPSMYLLYAPRKYRSSIKLARINKGAVTLRGSGRQQSGIYFSGDTDGLLVQNRINENHYGAIVIENLEIGSVGPKSAGRRALYCEAQHLQWPGPQITRMAFRSLTPGQEWGEAIHLHNSSHTTVAFNDIISSGYTVTEAVVVTTDNDLPAVEHTFAFNDIRSVKTGYRTTSTGANNGIEGVKIFGGNILAQTGIMAISGHGAPDFVVSGTHINAFGGESAHFEKWTQISFSAAVFYQNSFLGVTPIRAVYIKDGITVKGYLMINLIDNIATGVELAGSGQGFVPDVTVHATYGASHGVVVPASGWSNVKPRVDRIWKGVNGPNTGKPVNDQALTTAQLPLYVLASSASPGVDKSIIRYNATADQWQSLPAVKAVAVPPQYAGASATLDMSNTDCIEIGNGSTNITLQLDVSTLVNGGEYTFKRYDNSSSGTITIQSSNSSLNLIQNEGGVFLNSYQLPTTSGQRQVRFKFNGSHLIFIGQ